MPFVWIEYGCFNVVSPKVYMQFEDCVASIKKRIEENPDEFPYKDFTDGSSEPGEEESDCKENGMIIYQFYDDYDKEFQIYWVDIV